MDERIPAEITDAPMRTVQSADLNDRYASPAKELNRMAKKGMLKNIARGIYTAAPDAVDTETWEPSLNEAAMAVATMLEGDRVPVLMGIGAATFHDDDSHRITSTVVAVPTRRNSMPLRRGEVVFLKRDVGRLRTQVESTQLGAILVTSLEQTVYDLLMNPDLGTTPAEAQEAADGLRPLIDAASFHDFVSKRRWNGLVKDFQGMLA